MAQNPLKGFLLALTASMTWGTLPLAVQQVLPVMNAQTLVWYRFVIAALGLLLLLGLSKKLPQAGAFSKTLCWIALIGVIGLAGNFFLFADALNYISPTTTQVLWQLAPFTMMLVGVLVFKEQFGRWQQIGIALLLIGLILFFNDKFEQILALGDYALGILLGAGAAFIWVAYGVAQKVLSEKFSSQQILLIIYSGCAVVFLPFADMGAISGMNGAAWGFFAYCCINTLIGYGSYAEALKHWDASKVSVVTVLLPVFTMIFSLLGHYFYPDTFADPDMNGLSYFGALIVVAGTLLASVGDKLFSKN